jgi:trehalose 6-phosphate phosphatase
MSHGNWVATTCAAYVAGRPVALLFDYDGTLTPIVAHPTLAILPDAARDRLRELSCLEGISVGVISGRPLADVSAKVGLDGLYYAGCGGGELDLRGTRVDSPLSPPTRELLVAAECEIRKHLPLFPGLHIESKPHGFTVHYRGAASAVVEVFRRFFLTVMERFPALRHLDVCRAYEVAPINGWDKSTAVEFILTEIGGDVFAVYFGDAENDLPGMAATVAAGGISVAVGDTIAAAARYHLESPSSLHTDLSLLSATLGNLSGVGRS